MKRFLKIIGIVVLSLLLLMGLIVFLVNRTTVQNWLAQKAVHTLSEKLHTKVSLQHIRIDFLNHVNVKGLYIEDKNGDTLLYAGEAQGRITDWFLFKKETPVISYIGLSQAYTHLYRVKKFKTWNYQFVIDAFDEGQKKVSSKNKNDFELDLKKITFNQVRVRFDDAWVGSDMDIAIGDFNADINTLNVKNHLLDISKIKVNESIFEMRDYVGGRSPKLKSVLPIDTSAFNTDSWVVKLNTLAIDKSKFLMNMSTKVPVAKEFDPDHIEINKINLLAREISIEKDTLTGDLKYLNAIERCGLVVKQIKGLIKISPNISEIKKLQLTTNYSHLEDYYAMTYSRFPDFLDYIDKVVMVGNLKQASIDWRDLIYFAPELKSFPTTLIQTTGSFKGTVAQFEAKKLQLKFANSSLTGNLSMKGLPNINNTLIDFQNGTIKTNNTDILNYAPSIKKNEIINLKNLKQIQYSGSYTGYIDRFAAKGYLTTNLGNIRSDVKMSIPNFDINKVHYDGEIEAENFKLGELIKLDNLGDITLNAHIDGNSFDPNKGEMKLKTLIKHFKFKEYDYKNIDVDGVIAKKKFDGKLLIDDPNLAMRFDGVFDYSQAMVAIQAKANILNCDLQKLHITNDSIQLAADFDLNAKGNNVDNFLGYGSLYNINLQHKGKRIAVDSIYVNVADFGNNNKSLSLESNDVSVHITGEYLISKLPVSVAYFLYNYIPNYIPPIKSYPPNQNFKFSVTTRTSDSILSFFTPIFKGFNNSKITGFINTNQQLLNLNMDVPFGDINGWKLNNIHVLGKGDYNKMVLTGDIYNVNFKDSLLDINAQFKTTIGNDSIAINLQTASPNQYGTATLNANGYVRGDSLFASFLPSDFYFNQNKWEIPSNNKIVITKNYLNIDQLLIHSGLQEIAVKTNNEGLKNNLEFKIKELDLSLLNLIKPVAQYQPEGRVSGGIEIDDLFSQPLITTDLNASQIKLGNDSLGDILIKGKYELQNKLIFLQKGTGIFRNDGALTLTGTLSLDTNSKESIDALINFENTPVAWSTNFLSGLFSQLKGQLNGGIHVTGTPEKPEVKGEVELQNGGAKLDYLGTYYSLPKAHVSVSNDKIDLGKIVLYDQYKNKGYLSGAVTHQRFSNFGLDLAVNSDQIEVLNLQDYENPLFYGHLVAMINEFSIKGPLDDLNIYLRATPAQPSQLFIPLNNIGDVGTYSYISFKKYGENQNLNPQNKTKISLKIDALSNPLAEITILLDPVTGDAIKAKGNGTINLEMNAGDDLKMFGNYAIDEGSYNYTFKQFFNRQFSINSGSRIAFNGNLNKTELNVNAAYKVRASLYDLLSNNEKGFITSSDLADTKRMQDVNVLLNMKGNMLKPDLKYKIELPEKRSVGTFAYDKLESINNNERELTNQVLSLLLIGYFIPPEGISNSSSAVSSVANNFSEIISTQASTQITNIVNKILGDQKLSINLNYKNYNLNNDNNDIFNRNEVKFGLRRNFLNDRLIVEAGSSYDWGKNNNQNTSNNKINNNFNALNDVRIQYLLSQDGRFRLNGFHTSTFDPLSLEKNQNVSRSGIGLSWRKSFDNFEQFLRSYKYLQSSNYQLNNNTSDIDRVIESP